MCCVPWINLHLLDPVCMCVGERFGFDYHHSPFITHCSEQQSNRDGRPPMLVSAHQRSNQTPHTHTTGAPLSTWPVLGFPYSVNACPHGKLESPSALSCAGSRCLGSKFVRRMACVANGGTFCVFNAVSSGINHSVQLVQFPLSFLFLRSTAMLMSHTLAHTHLYACT